MGVEISKEYKELLEQQWDILTTARETQTILNTTFKREEMGQDTL